MKRSKYTLLVFLFVFLPGLNNILFAGKPDSLVNLYRYHEENKDFKAQISVLFKLAEHYRHDGNREKSDSVIDLALNLAVKTSDKYNIAQAYNFLAVNKSHAGNYKAAVELYEKSLEMYRQMNDALNVASIYENMGVSYKETGDYINAADVTLKALQIREDSNYTERIPSLYANLGAIFDLMGDIDKQEFYLRKAVESVKKYDGISKYVIASVYNQYANLFDNLKMLDSAEYYYMKSYQIVEELNWKRGIAVVLGNLAEVYQKSGQIDKAIESHLITLGIEKDIDNPHGITQEYYFLASLFDIKDQHDKAIYYSKLAYTTAEKYELTDQRKKVCNQLSFLYQEFNDFENALKYRNEYVKLNDSLHSMAKKQKVRELEMKYQVKLKQNQIDLLSAENQIKNQQISYGILLFLLLLTGIIIFTRIQRRRNQLRQNELQQKLLRSQMNPHFLFNALGSIQSYIVKNERHKAASYLESFSILTRSVLNNSVKEAISLQDEIDMLRSYIELEQLRRGFIFDYRFVYNENLETEFIFIPPMMIQPFVENSIKHASAKENQKFNIEVLFELRNENVLEVQIIDDGIGLNESQKLQKQFKHKSMAVKLISERRRCMQKKYKRSLDFEIKDRSDISENNGTFVSITLPVIEE